MIDIHISDETTPLKSVVLGIADDLGGTPPWKAAYDPKSKEHIRNGTFPKEADLKRELDAFLKVLDESGVKVYRPAVIRNYNQIFARDIGFVVDNKFVRSHMLAPREQEIEGIQYIIDQIDPEKVLESPVEARVEGGDVMPWKDYLFVGYSEKEDFEKYIVSRTNKQGVDFLKSNFPDREVMAFQLIKSDLDPKNNALHLDCCFQPIGKGQAIIYKGGFKMEEDYHLVKKIFGPENLIEIDQQEMYEMYANVFSIDPETIVSERNFNRLNDELSKRGFKVIKIPYRETAKMEGLLRCSTLPLFRE